MTAMTGRCLCGQVTITVTGAPAKGIGVCHCRMCQRWTGGVFMAFTVPAAQVTVDGEATSYPSSEFADRAFCPRCGSHLWFRGHDGPYELMPGLFDAAAAMPLVSEIYIDRAMASCRFAGEHRRSTAAEYEADNPFVEGDAP